jgi:hypothetical protein
MIFVTHIKYMCDSLMQSALIDISKTGNNRSLGKSIRFNVCIDLFMQLSGPSYFNYSDQ